MPSRDIPAEVPSVSVVIPTHNDGPTLARALESALAQQSASVEVIVVDDGSTDNTREILTPFRNRIKYLYQATRGPASARNLGIGSCSTQYVSFLDADDEWLPDRIIRGIQPMLDDPKIGMTYCWATRRDARGREVVRNRRSPSRNSLHRILWPDPLQCTPATTCRASVLAAVGGFDESLRTREDSDLWIRIGERYDVVAVEEPLVIVHYDAEEDASRPEYRYEKQREDYFSIAHKALDRDPDRYGPKRSEILGEAHLYWGRYALFHRLLPQARNELTASLKYLPRLNSLPYLALTYAPEPLLNLLRNIYGRRI